MGKVAKEVELERALRTELEELGFRPLAILPEKFWNSLLKEAKTLYVFYRIDSDGVTWGDWRRLEGELFKNSALVFFAQRCLFAVKFCLLLSFLFFFINPSIRWLVTREGVFTYTFGKENILLLTVMLVFGFFIGFLSSLAYFDGIIERNVLRFRAKKMKNLVEIAFPRRNDIHLVTDRVFKVRLPPLPGSFIATKNKADNLGIETFLVADRSSFEVSIDGVALGAMYGDEPILGMEKNGMIALLDQSGEYPDEQKLIGMAKEYFSPVMATLVPLQQN